MDGRLIQDKLSSTIAKLLLLSAPFVLAWTTSLCAAAPLVPGTGERIEKIGDDFEDEKWSYTFNFPKSSNNIDHNLRLPGGYSNNHRWGESAKRGQPDVIKRVPTPTGGLQGSTGSMLMQTRISGVPGRPSWKMQQDDFLVNLKQHVGGFLPISRSPNYVVHVYLPPFENWENRTGTSFGLRADVRGSKNSRNLEPYWPGIFIHFNSETDPRFKEDSAKLLLRAGPRGYEMPGPEIKEPGWWTLGMSFTPDGQVHYYGHAGVEDLTEKDHLGSQFPYGFRCRQFHTLFFNVANMDDGRTMSTPWVVDDVEIYFVRPGGASTARVRMNSRR